MRLQRTQQVACGRSSRTPTPIFRTSKFHICHRFNATPAPSGCDRPAKSTRRPSPLAAQLADIGDGGGSGAGNGKRRIYGGGSGGDDQTPSSFAHFLISQLLRLMAAAFVFHTWLMPLQASASVHNDNYQSNNTNEPFQAPPGPQAADAPVVPCTVGQEVQALKRLQREVFAELLQIRSRIQVRRLIIPKMDSPCLTACSMVNRIMAKLLITSRI